MGAPKKVYSSSNAAVTNDPDDMSANFIPTFPPSDLDNALLQRDRLTYDIGVITLDISNPDKTDSFGNKRSGTKYQEWKFRAEKAKKSKQRQVLRIDRWMKEEKQRQMLVRKGLKIRDGVVMQGVGKKRTGLLHDIYKMLWRRKDELDFTEREFEQIGHAEKFLREKGFDIEDPINPESLTLKTEE
ncbi:MAG: hypothetical protein WC805_00965 [Patescibacteria group bacterium]|jgi:hypothetical protein